MRTAAIGLTTILVLASGSFGPARADSPRPLLVPGYEAAKDLPGARELPDPKMDYKVVFADGQDAKNPGDVNPMLPTIATYVNTLGQVRRAGGPSPPRDHVSPANPGHRHRDDQRGVQGTLQARQPQHRADPRAQAGRRRHPRLRSGIDRRKIEANQVNPDVQIDLWAMTTLVNLQLKGYVRVG